MDRKELKKTQGVTANKTKAKPKKTPVRKKKVVASKINKEKKKTAKKTDKKKIRKVKVKAKVESRKEKTAGKRKNKEAKRVKVKKEQEAEKKKVTSLLEKVEIKQSTAEPQKKMMHKEVSIAEKKTRKKKKVMLTQKEKRYPPLPVEILPEEYGEDSIALMTVDPRKLFIYWEVTQETFKKHKGTLNIRLYDVMGIEFDGTNAKSCFDIVVNTGIGNLYLVVNSDKEFIADIGMVDSSGTFSVVARSNRVSTPRAEVLEKGILPQRLYETGVETGLPILPIGYEK
ncbi:MAG: hypothetical protein A2Y81_12235 [Nitrospirae bacterium RBG_13_43_8]|nr:MAG: hypothetical protein A2Y81_12235 [Nitrospirae bacterium RBG_13_43_8]